MFPALIRWQLANASRYQEVFTLIFLDLRSSCDLERELLQQLRNTDLLFSFPGGEVAILLFPNAGEDEAKAFIKRIFSHEAFQQERVGAALLEIQNGTATPEEILERGRNVLKRVMELKDLPAFLGDSSFSIREPQHIRVSIIDEDPIVTLVMTRLIERLAVEGIDFDIQVFHDGQTFVDSDWYRSSHIHLVIVNDVLPKKNGLDVLYTLRELPNAQKYYIFMMTKRNSENDMIYSYEHGVDELMTKPFSPRLFQAQVKKVLNRIYYG